MPSLKPYNGPTRLVVAFDIGTTFSGISYCILERGQVPEIYGVMRRVVYLFVSIYLDLLQISCANSSYWRRQGTISLILRQEW